MQAKNNDKQVLDNKVLTSFLKIVQTSYSDVNY